LFRLGNLKLNSICVGGFGLGLGLGLGEGLGLGLGLGEGLGLGLGLGEGLGLGLGLGEGLGLGLGLLLGDLLGEGEGLGNILGLLLGEGLGLGLAKTLGLLLGLLLGERLGLLNKFNVGEGLILGLEDLVGLGNIETLGFILLTLAALGFEKSANTTLSVLGIVKPLGYNVANSFIFLEVLTPAAFGWLIAKVSCTANKSGMSLTLWDCGATPTYLPPTSVNRLLYSANSLPFKPPAFAAALNCFGV